MHGLRVGRLTEAGLVDVKAKDFVSWSASSGVARGRVKSVHKGKVPAVPVKVVGTEIEPAARVEQYTERDGGWVPTGRYHGIASGSLTRIEDLPAPEAKSTEARAVVDGSFDQIRRQVQAAIEDRLEAEAEAAGSRLADNVYVYVCDIGPDWAVYNSGFGDDQFKVSYSIDAAGKVTLGEPAEVLAVTTYEPVAQADEEPTAAAAESRREQDRVTGHLLEAKGVDATTGGRIFGVRIIEAGDSLNGRRYPQPVLEAAAPLYEGAKAFDHHRTEAELRTSTIAGLIGSYRNVEPKTDGVYGDLYLLPSATHTAEALDASLAAQEAGLKPLVGISHDVMASYRPVVDGGRRLQEATQIVSVNSADVVADPAAGGRATRMVAGGIATDTKENPVTLEELLALLASATPEQRQSLGLAQIEPPAAAGAGTATEAVIQRESLMGGTLITAAVAAANVPAALAGKVTEAVTGVLPEEFTEAQLTGQVASVIGVLGAFEKANLVPTVPSVEVTKEAFDKKVERLDATFEAAATGDWSKGYRSFKEAFFDITGERPSFAGDSDINRHILVECIGGVGSRDFSQRTPESVTTGTFSTVLGDAITRRMVTEYQQPSLSSWRQVVSSIIPVNDFRTQRVERLGGYGTLPVVNQGAPYQPLTTPGNEEATYALNKKGGTEDLTLETIANDDMRVVARIPVKLGLAAAQTLFRFVWDMLANNVTCSYDATALFAAGHNNIDAGNLLSQINLSAARKKMRKQTAYGDSTDVLSIVPKYLIVPSDLEELAFQLCTSAVAIPATPAGPTNTPNIHQGLTPIVVDYFTAAGTWFLEADPAMVPTIEIGFYQGRQDPDLLVQSDPTAGSVFTADKITYKIRHIYSGTPLDHRGWYRGN